LQLQEAKEKIKTLEAKLEQAQHAKSALKHSETTVSHKISVPPLHFSPVADEAKENIEPSSPMNCKLFVDHRIEKESKTPKSVRFNDSGSPTKLERKRKLDEKPAAFTPRAKTGTAPSSWMSSLRTPVAPSTPNLGKATRVRTPRKLAWNE
jgi:hypothetical protein